MYKRQDGTEYWFYAQNNGDLVKSQIKTINNYRYAFNEKGEMLHGLYMLTFDDDKKIDSYEEIEAESDLPDSAAPFSLKRYFKPLMVFVVSFIFLPLVPK